MGMGHDVTPTAAFHPSNNATNDSIGSFKVPGMPYHHQNMQQHGGVRPNNNNNAPIVANNNN